jgi:two-component system, sensor histidine kinase RetS
VEKNLFGKCDYELILIDCEMPFMDGYEATRQIVSFLSSHCLREPHIIAVSGHTDQLHQDLCLEAGME